MSPEEMIERWREKEDTVLTSPCGGETWCLTYAQCETELTAALKAAKEEGRREGLVEAAAAAPATLDCGYPPDGPCDYTRGWASGVRQMSQAIRALAAKEEKHG